MHESAEHLCTILDLSLEDTSLLSRRSHLCPQKRQEEGRLRLNPLSGEPPRPTLPRSNWSELGHTATPAARELGK